MAGRFEIRAENCPPTLLVVLPIVWGTSAYVYPFIRAFPVALLAWLVVPIVLGIELGRVALLTPETGLFAIIVASGIFFVGTVIFPAVGLLRL